MAERRFDSTQQEVAWREQRARIAVRVLAGLAAVHDEYGKSGYSANEAAAEAVKWAEALLTELEK